MIPLLATKQSARVVLPERTEVLTDASTNTWTFDTSLQDISRIMFKCKDLLILAVSYHSEFNRSSGLFKKYSYGTCFTFLPANISQYLKECWFSLQFGSNNLWNPRKIINERRLLWPLRTTILVYGKVKYILYPDLLIMCLYVLFNGCMTFDKTFKVQVYIV